MQTALFKGREWQKHGDYWLLISKTKIPAAVYIPIAPPKREMTKDDELRATAALHCVGD